MAHRSDIALDISGGPATRGTLMTRLTRRGGTLTGSVAYSLGGSLLFLLTQLGLLSSLSHLRGPAAVGEFGLALALTTPLFSLTNMGMRTAQAVDVSEQFSFADYGGVKIILTSLAIVACIATGWIFAETLHTFLVVAVICGAKAFESVSNLSYGAFQQVNRMDLVARSLFVRGAVSLAAFVGLLLLSADVLFAFLAQFVTWAGIALLLDYPQASRLVTGSLATPRLSRRCWGLIRRSAPLSGASFANNLQGSIPRLFIQSTLGLSELGVFTVTAYFQRAGIVASNAVLHGVVNRLARLHRAGDATRIKLVVFVASTAFLAIGAAGILTCYYFAEAILRLLFGQPFAGAASLLVVIAAALALRMLSTVPQAVLVAQQRFGAFFWVQLGCLGVTAAACPFLIPEYGLLGAGYALLVAAIFRLLALAALFLLLPQRMPGASLHVQTLNAE